MIKSLFIFLLMFTVLMPAAIAQPGADLSWTTKVGAPGLPASQKIFNTADYGAAGDTSVTSTVFIQKAIDDCAAKGGGIVIFSPGTY